MSRAGRSGEIITVPVILHKLMEEVLTGEIPEAEAALTERAGSGSGRHRPQFLRRQSCHRVGDRRLAEGTDEVASLTSWHYGRSSGRVSRLFRTSGRRRGNRNGWDSRGPDPDGRRPSRRCRGLEKRCDAGARHARSLSCAGAGLSRHDWRRARTDRADDIGHCLSRSARIEVGDCRHRACCYGAAPVC